MKIAGKGQRLIFLVGVLAAVMMLWPSALALAEYLADPTAPTNPEIPATQAKKPAPDDPDRDDSG